MAQSAAPVHSRCVLSWCRSEQPSCSCVLHISVYVLSLLAVAVVTAHHVMLRS